MPGFKRNSRTRRRVQAKKNKNTIQIIIIAILGIIVSLLCILSWKTTTSMQEQLHKYIQTEQDIKKS